MQTVFGGGGCFVKGTHNISNFLNKIIYCKAKEKEVDKWMWCKYPGSRQSLIYGYFCMGGIE